MRPALPPQAGRGEICPPPSTKPPQRLRSWAVPPRILPAPPDQTAELLPDRFRRWSAGRGWSPREHQLALLAKARDDRSALLIAPTGAGKPLAGFLPTLVELSGGQRTSLLPPPLRGRSTPEGRREGGAPLAPNDTAFFFSSPPPPPPPPPRRAVERE